MANIIFKRGTSQQMANQPLIDGLLSFTTDDGKIHMDYVDENKQLKRKTMYGGKLTFGKYSYDGSQDVAVDVYTGAVNE